MSIKDNGVNKLFDKIEMPEDVKKNIYNNCSNHSRGLGRKYMLKKVAFAAVFLVTVTIGGVGVKAGFDSYKDRMKNIPKEEREQAKEIFYNGNAFDIPFLKESLNKIGLDIDFTKKNCYDALLGKHYTRL